MYADLIPDWLWLVLANVSIASLVWLILGRDRRGRGVIIPSEEIIADVKPYEAGALLAQWATYASFVSLILDLEQRKIVRLERYEGGGYLMFTVERLSKSLPMDELENAVLRRLMRYPFSEPNEKEEAGSATLALWSEQCRLAYRLFETLVHRRFVKRGWFSINPLHLYVMSGTFLLVWTYGLFLFLESRIYDPRHNWIFIQIVLIAPILYAMPRLTKEGALVREQVKGLARYIEVAEKDRLRFHESPKSAGEKKSNLLAYAVGLNILKEWTKHYLSGFEAIKDEERKGSTTNTESE